jgi:DNA processing protein
MIDASRSNAAAPGESTGSLMPGALPPEAYAAALAGLPGMGPARLAALLEARAPADAWEDLRRGTPAWSWPSLGVTLGSDRERLLRGWHVSAKHIDLEALWQHIVEERIGVALHGGAGYPAALLDDVEPPVIVFQRGAPEVVSGPRVAIVGTRRCTAAGAGIAVELGRNLAAAGVAVVSGLASGIDAASHRGALDARAAPPIGVVATGLDVVYPRSQRDLWERVARSGVLMAEAPPGTAPERWRFPARNRIIAALADIVVVVESHRTGGALYTVDEADRRATDVMVVPGSVRSPASAGTNDLLAEGRPPVRDADDVLLALGLTSAARHDEIDPRHPAADEDKPVLQAVGWQPSSLDQIVLRTGLPLPRLVVALDRLCDAGWLCRRGGWYERVASWRDHPVLEDQG